MQWCNLRKQKPEYLYMLSHPPVAVGVQTFQISKKSTSEALMQGSFDQHSYARKERDASEVCTVTYLPLVSWE